MRRFWILVLIEDSVERGQERHAIEALIKQTLYDQLGLVPWDPRARQIADKLIVYALNSNTKLKRACEDADDERNYFSAVSRVVAVYDSDRIRELFGLAAAACRANTVAAALTRSPYRARLDVVLLERNMETILSAICERAAIDPEVRTKAIDRKKLNERDIVLRKAARPAPDARAIRDHVLERVPSLAYLVKRLKRLLELELAESDETFG